MATTVRLYSGTTEVIIDGRELQELLESPRGPVYRDTIRRADRVVQRARDLAPVGRVRPARAAGPRSAIPAVALREGIVKRTSHDSHGFVLLIGSTAAHAGYVSRGTDPHIIRPRKAGGRLAFYWPKKGRVVAFPQVKHPGTKPNDYLQRALIAAGEA